MKPCDDCYAQNSEIARVCIGKYHPDLPFWQRFIGIVLIYLPLLTLPFVFLSAYLSYWHLKMVGAKNVRTFSSFLPDKNSFRYTMKNQIVMEPSYPLSPTQFKAFWILNCTWYCPVSVALFEWHAYLVKIVENWWCPFYHSKKNTHYQEGAIDRSFWHAYSFEVVKLDPEDRDNPIWNQDAPRHPSHDAPTTNETTRPA